VVGDTLTSEEREMVDFWEEYGESVKDFESRVNPARGYLNSSINTDFAFAMIAELRRTRAVAGDAVNAITDDELATVDAAVKKLILLADTGNCAPGRVCELAFRIRDAMRLYDATMPGCVECGRPTVVKDGPLGAAVSCKHEPSHVSVVDFTEKRAIAKYRRIRLEPPERGG
jgi:hypothetical protein